MQSHSQRTHESHCMCALNIDPLLSRPYTSVLPGLCIWPGEGSRSVRTWWHSPASQLLVFGNWTASATCRTAHVSVEDFYFSFLLWFLYWLSCCPPNLILSGREHVYVEYTVCFSLLYLFIFNTPFSTPHLPKVVCKLEVQVQSLRYI